MDVTAASVAAYVDRMSDWTDDEEDEGIVDIRFRGPAELRDALDALAAVQAEQKRLRKKPGKYSTNRFINFITKRYVRKWVQKFGPIPTTKEATRKAAEAVNAYEDAHGVEK